MLKISRESEINLVNVLIDNDIISGKDLINIKKISTESNKSQIDAIFELKESLSYLSLLRASSVLEKNMSKLSHSRMLLYIYLK